MKYPDTILNLIDCFKRLPGIGEKTAERLALSILNMDDEIVNLFSNSLLNMKSKIKFCKICNNFSENDICKICSDDSRNKKIICVVEDAKNIIQIEKTNKYNGLYHVLNGLISPIDGINPEDINLFSLLERVKNEKIEEIILALKPSIEGETTALYISKVLKDEQIKISKIANGVPMGADIDYVDSLTLELALENRMNININN